MNTFLYDFSKNKEVSPLEGVTHFYISPYSMDAWTTLNIGKKITDEDVELVIQTSTNLPIIIMPISLLNLGKCMIRLNEDFSGKITSGNKTMYFSTTAQDHIICISTVIIR
jgi:hypothetical protein